MGLLAGLRQHLGGGQEQEGADKRKYERNACNQRGNFIDHDGSPRDCTILNMSLGGLLISTAARIRPKEVIGFVSPSFEAKVVWTKRNIAGRNLAGLSFVQAVQ